MVILFYHSRFDWKSSQIDRLYILILGMMSLVIFIHSVVIVLTRLIRHVTSNINHKKKINMINKLFIAVLTVFSISTSISTAEDWIRVAYDNCGVEGKQPHVSMKGGNYAYSNKEISFKVVPKESALRTVIYGDRKVGLKYGGLKQDAKYKLKLNFLSDKVDRALRIVLNDKVSLQKFQLPKGVTVLKELEVPAGIFKKGVLEVRVETVEGLNSVLSTVELLSTVAGLNQQLAINYAVMIGNKIKGTVVDINSNTGISAATLTFGQAKVMTDKDGEFIIEIPKDVKDLTLRTSKGKLEASVVISPKELETYIIPRLSPRPAVEKRISLNGTWKFKEEVPHGFPKDLSAVDKEIQVPGEWVMQGFTVKKNTSAAFARLFEVPASMKGKRIKLRFDGVYSDTTVFVNGKKVGGHVGGFTPFELDVTDFVKLGKNNELALTVCNESLADTMASGTQYACHQLGGISRKVTLFALPQFNISEVRVETAFDSKFINSTLIVDLKLVNEGTKTRSSSVKIELIDPKGMRVQLVKPLLEVEKLASGVQVEKQLRFDIRKPLKWDNENPYLYVLNMTLKTGEVYTQKIGFKKIETKGDQIFVNGKPIKFRGCNRHEVHPLRGRSLEKGLWRQDVKLFRDSNINLIRTSHYPPAEELMQAADEEGIFVEIEGPFCWEWKSKDPTHLNLTVQQNMEMVIANRNHPSVLVWSIANESGWGPNFVAATEAMRVLDPTRSRIFHAWYGNIQKYTEPYCEIANIHYPGYNGPKISESYKKRPVYFGEYIHLNAYNRLELASDRGLRDQWGSYLSKIWEQMYAVQGCLGGSIWSGIDDTFYLKDDITVGYGTWGPIDGWRRKKPEWYHVKKVYSPIRILNQTALVAVDGSVKVEVENRQDFSNLNRLEIIWAYGETHGAVKADVATKTKGTFSVPCNTAKNDGQKLSLKFIDPRGFEVDTFLLPVGKVKKQGMISDMMYRVTSSQNANAITLKSHGVSYEIDKKTGLFTSVNGKNGKVELSGPSLMLLVLNSTGSTQMTGKTLNPKPFTSPCSQWKMTSIKLENDIVTVVGNYKEAKGKFTYSFNSDGTLNVDYDFTSKVKINPRQIGLVFNIPAEFKNLSWKRKGLWSTYPKWHIGRLQGHVSSTAGFEATSVGPRTKPNHEWFLDRGPAGSHDFSSTKHNIFNASLTNDSGFGVGVVADGDQHTRAWINNDDLRLLVAYFSNGGSERFLRRLSGVDDRHLQIGSKIKSRVKLNLVNLTK